MNDRSLFVDKLERRLSNGKIESLRFAEGLNLLVGPPNTGKTRWLQTLDYILGDSGASPFESEDDEHLAKKYDTASAVLLIGEERFEVERRWNEAGVKTKVFVNGVPTGAQEFQQLLLEKLGIPLLHFPKGNPMSGHTWPELSFRMLLRHIYRRQRLWSDLADSQPDGEQQACVLQFVGLADKIFTDEYGKLISLKIESENLRARRDQYEETLKELAGELLTDPALQSAISPSSVREAETRLNDDIGKLRASREQILISARDSAVPPADRSRTEKLGEQRASLIISLEELHRRLKDIIERLASIREYRTNLGDELERLARAQDAGEVLADLRITHCPACDQSVSASATAGHCFLCQQTVSTGPDLDGLGATRLRFESERISGEIEEADELLKILSADERRTTLEIKRGEESLRMIENELVPLRTAVSSLVQEQVSNVDMALGELNERQRQLTRLKNAVELGAQLTRQILAKEKEIEPLEAHVNEVTRALDFAEAESRLADGMNEYLEAIKRLKPGSWPHSPVSVSLSRYTFSIRVGSKKWTSALGGTDSLYFLMAYHYGLLSLSDKNDCHYPGIVILDMPAEFAGESIEDKENFIVQPFIELMKRQGYERAQAIITGASFTGLEAASRHQLKDVHVA